MNTTRSRRLVLALAATFLLGPGLPAGAERIASRAEEGSPARAAASARVSDALAQEAVARALAAHGLSPDQVEERVRQLSDQDLERLAANLDQIQPAGSVPDYIWILLGIFLAVSILAMIF